MRTHNNLLLREITQKECGEQVRRELRLTHTRRDINNHPLFLTSDDIAEDFRQLPMVWSFLEPRIYGVCKAEHGSLGLVQLEPALFLFQVLKKLRFFFGRHHG